MGRCPHADGEGGVVLLALLIPALLLGTACTRYLLHDGVGLDCLHIL